MWKALYSFKKSNTYEYSYESTSLNQTLKTILMHSDAIEKPLTKIDIHFDKYVKGKKGE